MPPSLLNFLLYGVGGLRGRVIGQDGEFSQCTKIFDCTIRFRIASSPRRTEFIWGVSSIYLAAAVLLLVDSFELLLVGPWHILVCTYSTTLAHWQHYTVHSASHKNLFDFSRSSYHHLKDTYF